MFGECLEEGVEGNNNAKLSSFIPYGLFSVGVVGWVGGDCVYCDVYDARLAWLDVARRWSNQWELVYWKVCVTCWNSWVKGCVVEVGNIVVLGILSFSPLLLHLTPLRVFDFLDFLEDVSC